MTAFCPSHPAVAVLLLGSSSVCLPSLSSFFFPSFLPSLPFFPFPLSCPPFLLPFLSSLSLFSSSLQPHQQQLHLFPIPTPLHSFFTATGFSCRDTHAQTHIHTHTQHSHTHIASSPLPHLFSLAKELSFHPCCLYNLISLCPLVLALEPCHCLLLVAGTDHRRLDSALDDIALREIPSHLDSCSLLTNKHDRTSYGLSSSNDTNLRPRQPIVTAISLQQLAEPPQQHSE